MDLQEDGEGNAVVAKSAREQLSREIHKFIEWIERDLDNYDFISLSQEVRLIVVVSLSGSVHHLHGMPLTII